MIITEDMDYEYYENYSSNAEHAIYLFSQINNRIAVLPPYDKILQDQIYTFDDLQSFLYYNYLSFRTIKAWPGVPEYKLKNIIFSNCCFDSRFTYVEEDNDVLFENCSELEGKRRQIPERLKFKEIFI